MYTALCIHHPKSNCLPSSYIWPPLLFITSTPFHLVNNHTVVCVYEFLFVFLVCPFVVFSFISHTWMKSYGVGGSAHGHPTFPPPPATTDENKSTKTLSAWGGNVVDLSEEKGQEPFPQWAFIGFSLHRNTGKAHQSLSGSEDQTIDNIQRTLSAYSESGSVS